MNDPKVDATQPAMLAFAYPEVQEVTYLWRALEIAEQDGLGVGRADLQRVEAMWSVDDDDCTSLGFVLSLHDGRRVYVQYLFDFGDDEEEVELRPMGVERYPDIERAGRKWIDDVGELNRLLMC